MFFSHFWRFQEVTRHHSRPGRGTRLFLVYPVYSCKLGFLFNTASSEHNFFQVRFQKCAIAVNSWIRVNSPSLRVIKSKKNIININIYIFFYTLQDIFSFKEVNHQNIPSIWCWSGSSSISEPIVTEKFADPWFRNNDQISKLTSGRPPSTPPGQQPLGAPRVWQPPPFRSPPPRLQTFWLQSHCFAPLLCSLAWQSRTLA